MKYSLKVLNEKDEFVAIIHTDSLDEYVDFLMYYKESYDKVTVLYNEDNMIVLEVQND